MSQPDRLKNYTSETLAAMRAQGLLPAEPEPQQVPTGHLRYTLAIEGITTTHGIATPAAVAATLRGFADQIDPQKEHHA